MPRLHTICPTIIKENELSELQGVLPTPSIEAFMTTPTAKIAKQALERATELESSLTAQRIDEIRKHLVAKYSTSIIRADNLLKANELLPFTSFSCGAASIDNLLQGGIFPKHITEIYGPQATGKSMFCLSTALSAIQTVAPVTVLYLDSQNAFSGRKLASMFEKRKARWQRRLQNQNSMTDEESHNDFSTLMEVLTKIRCVQVYDIFQLIDSLQTIIRELRSKSEMFYSTLRIIIIDSIAQLLLPSIQNDVGERMMFDIIQLLRILATEFNIAVLVTNLATQTSISHSSDHPLQALRPTLGEIWRSVPSRRVLLYRYEQSVSVTGRLERGEGDQGTVITRRAFIAKSILDPPSVTPVEFRIDTAGLSSSSPNTQRFDAETQ